MRKYLIVVFSLILNITLCLSCTSLSKTDMVGLEDLDDVEEIETVMEEFNYVEIMEKMNSKSSCLTKYIEITDDYKIIIHYKNESNEVYVIPLEYFSSVDTRLDSDFMYKGVINGMINIQDLFGNNLVVNTIFVDYDISYTVPENKCLKMNPGDEYISEELLLDKLIYLEKLKGTGIVIKIYYGFPTCSSDDILSNIVLLSL